MTPSEFLMNAMDFSIGLVILAIAIGFIRIVRGPTLADRVVALDMMTTTIAAFCALVSVRAGGSSFVDVGIVVALVGFLATNFRRENFRRKKKVFGCFFLLRHFGAAKNNLT